MSVISDANTVGYVNSVSALQPVQPKFDQAGFAAYLEEAENSAASGQSSAVTAAVQPAITGLLSSNSAPKIVEAQEPEVEEDQTSSGQTAREKFQEYMEMTPEERFFVAMLEKKGYTKEEYEALPLEEKLKLQKEIAEEAKELTERKVETGQVGEGRATETTPASQSVTGIAATRAAEQRADRDKAMDWL